MVRIAKFSASTGFPLDDFFDKHPEVVIELERIVPTHEFVIPYFWMRNADSDDVLTTLRDNPGVQTIRLIDEVNGDALVRVEWSTDMKGIISAVENSEVTLLSAEGSNEGWTFEIRGEGSAEIHDFQDRSRENGIPIQLVNLHALTPLRGKRDHSLTETQREALIRAYERGYYDSPQQVTLEEMANELGITGQSFGSRLRRGIKRLIGSTLIETD
jgi:predicted DNA binding protein